MSRRAKPLSIREYEQYSSQYEQQQQNSDPNRTEYDRMYSSSSIAGHLSSSYDATRPPASARYPDVDNMSAVRASLNAPSKSIWAAARETSQSLEFDVYLRRSNDPYHDNLYLDTTMRSNPNSAPPPGSSGPGPAPSGPAPSGPAPSLTAAPPPPAVDRKAQATLERRLAKLEAENDKLKKTQEQLLKKAASGRPVSSSSAGAPAAASISLSGGGNEKEAFLEIRQSIEKGLSTLATMEKTRQQMLKQAER
ncbi:hypothetical protein TeGR_g8018, partial [Tetraparma gracilis]